MKITILTYGSRGEVQPFLPLSLRLMEEGYSVKLAAPFRFKNLVEGYGIDFVPLAGEPEELSRRLNNAGYNFVKMIRALMNHAIDIGADILRQTEEACQDADLIIHTFVHAVGAHTLAREKNIPDIHIQTFPMFTPTGDYPNVTLPDLGSRALNRQTHTFSEKITWWTSQIGFERVRRGAGLAKRKLCWPFDDDPLRPRTPILCAWSPNILPASSDWPSHVHVTGYYFFPLNDTYQPPAELHSFLQAGKPPVCITFGSMVNRDAERIDHIVREALKQTGNRGIILSGCGGVEDRSANDVLYLDAVPHDWLLPRCKMVIQHGGAGTTAAGLRAGIPNLVLPFTADQPFWGRRVHASGAGPKPILVKNISIGKLTQAMVEAGTNAFRERAQAISQEIRSEDGIDEAVRLIGKYSNDFHNGHL
ncbi:MAG: glycosyltransferase [Chloroflexi bacterium]|nr:MAG: glycosyltransferase [Chloroflexota bacterium]